nr:HAMP domain-containing sensor histidine kinase [uncultured Oscillibacter sp.]
MTKRIFRSILAVALTVLAVSLVLIVGVLHRYFQAQALDELTSRTAYIALGIEHEGIGYLEDGFPNDCRVTWLAPDGAVLWDNREDPAQMENHADRREVLDALALGKGYAARYSNTLSQKTLYYALRLSDGSVLRVSAAQSSVWMLALRASKPVALVMVLAFCLALWLARRLSVRLIAPINAIDLTDPGEELDYEELAPLVGRIRSQNREISRRMDDLRRSREEFRAITENMSEGLLIIDHEMRVLSYNAAALRLLDAQAPAEHDSVFALNREPGFRRCIEDALAGRRREEQLEHAEHCCRVLANPVEQEDRVSGAVLIVLDVTEKERRETLRREFTANVSHELKTPLTSILGTAEILENGLVKPQDIPHFAGNIHREAQRLIGLVNDIIKLSRLDEGAAAQWEAVDLHAMAEEVLRQLAPAAERRQITLQLEGMCGSILGVPRIVEEILYNLCDNAIAYNHSGGSVRVALSDAPGGRQVAVSDTGIGIPRELQERVFERFYRADKSRAGNGTGLGLSIVKHGAAYLGARVALDSEPGKGSTFTLTFPPA